MLWERQETLCLNAKKKASLICHSLFFTKYRCLLFSKVYFTGIISPSVMPLVNFQRGIPKLSLFLWKWQGLLTTTVGRKLLSLLWTTTRKKTAGKSVLKQPVNRWKVTEVFNNMHWPSASWWSEAVKQNWANCTPMVLFCIVYASLGVSVYVAGSQNYLKGLFRL